MTRTLPTEGENKCEQVNVDRDLFQHVYSRLIHAQKDSIKVNTCYQIYIISTPSINAQCWSIQIKIVMLMPISCIYTFGKPSNTTFSCTCLQITADRHWLALDIAVGNVLPVTRWLILSSAYKSWQSMMVSHRSVLWQIGVRLERLTLNDYTKSSWSHISVWVRHLLP